MVLHILFLPEATTATNSTMFSENEDSNGLSIPSYNFAAARYMCDTPAQLPVDLR